MDRIIRTSRHHGRLSANSSHSPVRSGIPSPRFDLRGTGTPRSGRSIPSLSRSPASTVYSCIDPQRGTRKHPWQFELPNRGGIDCANDAPVMPLAPARWTLLQRNGRLMVCNPSGITCQLDAAQAGMLELMDQGMDQDAFLDSLVTVCQCVTEQGQDGIRAAHWSRHLSHASPVSPVQGA